MWEILLLDPLSYSTLKATPSYTQETQGFQGPYLNQSDCTDEIASKKNNSECSKNNPKFQSSKNPHIKDTYL